MNKRRASELPKQYLGYNQFDVSNIKDQYKFKTRNTKGKPFTSKRLSKISNAVELFTNQEFASKTIDHEIMKEQIFPVNEDGLRKSIIESSMHDSFDNSKKLYIYFCLKFSNSGIIGEKIKRNRIFSEPTSPLNRNIDDHYIRSYNVDKSIGNWNIISPFDGKNVLTNKNPSKLIKIKRLTNKERRLLRAGEIIIIIFIAFPSAKENKRYKFHKVFETKEQIMQRYSKLAESCNQFIII